MQSSSSSATSNCSSSKGGSVILTSHSMQKFCPASSYGQLDCSSNLIIIQQYNNIDAEAQGDGNLCKLQDSSHSNSNSKSSTSTFLSICHDSNNNLSHMFEANPNPKTNLKTCPIPNPNPNCMQNPDCEFIKEGQGESNGDQMSSAYNGSPTSWDNSQDTDTVSCRLRQLSPTAASCFCKDIEEEQEYFQQLLGSSSHGWTDEKHSSYLDSMEADFLKSVMFKSCVHAEPSDLEDSATSSHQSKAAKEVCGVSSAEADDVKYHSEKPILEKGPQFRNLVSYARFKVCQNGRWRPMSVQAPYASIGPLKQIAVAVKNPWIKRFRASKRAYFPSLPLLEDANARFNARQQE